MNSSLRIEIQNSAEVVRRIEDPSGMVELIERHDLRRPAAEHVSEIRYSHRQRKDKEQEANSDSAEKYLRFGPQASAAALALGRRRLGGFVNFDRSTYARSERQDTFGDQN